MQRPCRAWPGPSSPSAPTGRADPVSPPPRTILRSEQPGHSKEVEVRCEPWSSLLCRVGCRNPTAPLDGCSAADVGRPDEHDPPWRIGIRSAGTVHDKVFPSLFFGAWCLHAHGRVTQVSVVRRHDRGEGVRVVIIPCHSHGRLSGTPTCNGGKVGR